MKICKLQSDRFFNLLPKKTTLFSKVAGLLILFNCAASTTLAAQRNQGEQAANVTGKVVDENNNPLSGVTVLVKNSNETATTNAAGNFSIEVPNRNAFLVFTHVGLERQEAAISDKIIIHLKASDNSLEEVVVVGYGTQKGLL